ncbi:MAG TPA: bifunctional phosphopantothenoylcysteine decarboxylase/phosphopantothenate--cysteine ligase CoaBC [Anaerolineales bacterium]|nr:bifunctional phosphopantothenoylcysteine decarboxylase/phosphopantothenate--cysteine ligase CoaBC [Anaerolineales bacterium]HNQ95504.1 bifunctional phosphopantothenoylcysteine decarboxylase/phosphopantothenate--cysteine ligase CoaBC [Anaerolineales bacterium]HNS60887.1 bifunctional phosphopantothenoylcysteine decarboxylase/phosphopantothenate--cysteine ligase CoaBC [Anaerolineales bacterium]
MSALSNKRILLGVTGSIAAYKAADLASKLTQAGAQVDVVLTESAQKFITPLTFQSVTGRRAYTDADLWGDEAHVLHVGLGHAADLLVIAPCTANTLAKLAHGQADSLLTVTALASNCPLLLAPAMDGGMYDHAATQENLDTLKKRGAYIIEPAEGHLASGLTGKGRLPETPELIGHIRLLLGRDGWLAKRKVIVTAGGTQEPLDPVRVLTNKSSGKQGYALAQAALDAGAEVTLITTPTSLTPPVGANVVNVQTAKQMLDAVLNESADADALIMAAAVADFRPKTLAKDKIKKEGGVPQVELEGTEDILKTVSSRRSDLKRLRVVAGFAAESQHLLENASNKLESKSLDMIAANDISASDAGFSVETNRVTLLFADGSRESLSLMSKTEVAEIMIERIGKLLG